MGIDYYVCTECEESYPDCGPCGWCSCGLNYCGDCHDDLRTKYGIFGEDLEDDDGNLIQEDNEDDPNYEEGSLRKCDYCSLVKVADYDLIPFLLEELKLTRQEAEDKYRAHVNSQKKKKKR